MLLLHEPLGTVEFNTVVVPAHKFRDPDKLPAKGGAVTVIGRVAVASAHPPEPVTVYVMVAGPAASADTKPEVAFTLATAVSLLLHEPPVEVDEKFAVAPTHRFWIPLNIPALAGE